MDLGLSPHQATAACVGQTSRQAAADAMLLLDLRGLRCDKSMAAATIERRQLERMEPGAACRTTYTAWGAVLIMAAGHDMDQI